MDLANYRITSNQTPIKLSDYPTSDNKHFNEEELKEKMIPESIKKLQELHLKLHAEEQKGIMVVLQAIDAGGKDEAISFIFSNLTAQGLKTTSVKKPSETEVKHDYLWRIHEGKPARGENLETGCRSWPCSRQSARNRPSGCRPRPTFRPRLRSYRRGMPATGCYRPAPTIHGWPAAGRLRPPWPRFCWHGAGR